MMGPSIEKRSSGAREGDHLLVMYGAPERELLQGYCGRKEWTSYDGKTVSQKKNKTKLVEWKALVETVRINSADLKDWIFVLEFKICSYICPWTL